MRRSKADKRHEADEGAQESISTTAGSENNHSPTSLNPTRSVRRLLRPRSLLKTCGTLLLIHLLIRGYYNLELVITDPFLEALLFMPVRYVRVRYREERPARIRTFDMRPNNTFVVNLDRDTARWRHFLQRNKQHNVTRFSAWQWIILDNKNRLGKTLLKNRDNNNTVLLQQQRAYEMRYPWLRYSAARGHYGDAGCSLSHILLLEQFLLSSIDDYDDSYIFVLEDDAILLPPLRDTGMVQAPADSEAVQLVEAATKTVRVPYVPPSNSNNAVRVLQGYGSLGYIVTAAGAQKLLQRMRLPRKREAIDVALLSSAAVKVYLPVEWPVVQHAPLGGGSTRRQQNG